MEAAIAAGDCAREYIAGAEGAFCRYLVGLRKLFKCWLPGAKFLGGRYCSAY
jgi:hypothetical protein